MTRTQEANLRKWVAALESGNYKQTRGTLRKVGYCCLGVWLNESGEGKWDGKGMYVIPATKAVRRRVLFGSLDDRSRDALGITEDDENRFIQLNDSSKANFKRIAAEVRKRYPMVFKEK